MGARLDLLISRYRRLTAGGWPSSFPVAQFPNPPLLVAIVGWLTAALASGDIHRFGRALFLLGLAVWAWEELAAGVNWFRRLIGAGVFIWLIAQVAAALA